MKVKPKQIPLIVPTVAQFDKSDDAIKFAETLNHMVHGKSKMKMEHLGSLAGKEMFLFYFARNAGCQAVRNEFKQLIEQEEVEK